ncbi:Ribose import ATP-binding protein RbsA [compost metagenome]
MPIEPILYTRALEKRFGGVKAVAGVDFSLAPGELRCLIGPNGAGKSTFFKLVTGQLVASSGEIYLMGGAVHANHPHEIAARGVGIKNQIPDVMNGLTARQNIWLAASRWHPATEVDKVVRNIAERLGLGSVLDKRVGILAHGQRQWVEIALVLSARPKIILLDEPAAGMSDEETEATANLLRELNVDTTIVVVEHDMHFIRAVARQVTVFHQGQILLEGSFDEVTANSVVRDVYLGRATGTQHA